jgi:hypothetical protein
MLGRFFFQRHMSINNVNKNKNTTIFSIFGGCVLIAGLVALGPLGLWRQLPSLAVLGFAVSFAARELRTRRDRSDEG